MYIATENGVCGSPLQADSEMVRVHLSGLQKRKECLFLYLHLQEERFRKLITPYFFTLYTISCFYMDLDCSAEGILPG